MCYYPKTTLNMCKIIQSVASQKGFELPTIRIQVILEPETL